MNSENSSWEAAIQEIAASLPYPPTPDVAAGIRQRLTAPPPRRSRRQLAYAAMLLLLLLLGLLAVPPVRAALLNFFRVGAVTIFVADPSTPEAAALPPLEATALPQAARVTLAEAQSQARFPLRLPPAYGSPDEIYLQQLPDPGLAGQVVIMVWRDPAQPELVRLRLYQIDATEYGLKHASIQAVRQAVVNGQNAFWVEGGHEFRLPYGVYLVEQDVLIWAEGDITYRLESALSFAETVRIAQSLRRLVPTP